MDGNSQQPAFTGDGRAVFAYDAAINLCTALNAKVIRIALQHFDGAIIGRSDSKSTYQPDVDLADMQAFEYGVSRRHAAFVRYQDRLHILDLGSINGTFLNGRRLLQETPYPLHPGDKLILGELLLTVSHADG